MNTQTEPREIDLAQIRSGLSHGDITAIASVLGCARKYVSLILAGDRAVNSDLSRDIITAAQTIAEAKATIRSGTVTREDNQKQDNGKKAKTAGRVPPAQKDTDKGSTGRQRGHSDRHDGEPVRPVSGMGKQDLRRKVQSSPRPDGDVSARSNTRA